MNKKIKIFHFTSALGGVGIYIDLLTQNINQEKFDNILIYNSKEKLFGDLNKIPSINLPIIREISIIKDFKVLHSLIKNIKKGKPDILHCHSSKAGIIGRIAGAITNTPTLYTPHSYYYLGQSGLKRILFQCIEIIFSKLKNSKVLACSNSEYYRATKELKINKKNVLVWCNSINDINSLVEKKESKIPYICTIGRPSKQKNILLMLEAFQKVKEKINPLQLKIIGVGYFSNQLELVKEYISAHHLEEDVELIDWSERESIFKFIKNSILYHSTSLYEGLPYSLIEAMSLGKAIVATKCDGNIDAVIEGETGFLTSFCADEISDKIIVLIKNNSLRESMEKSAYENFKNKFDISNNIILLENIYLNEINI